MPKTRIILPTRLTPPHRATVLKYFEATNRLSAGEWKLALEAFDILGSATLITGRRHGSFRQFYESTVERRHADRFLTELLAADDPEVKGERLQHQVAAAILANLEQEGLYHEDDLNGAVKEATLETAAGLFPEPVQIVFEGRRFVVVTFDLWKDRVKRRQEQEN